MTFTGILVSKGSIDDRLHKNHVMRAGKGIVDYYPKSSNLFDVFSHIIQDYETFVIDKWHKGGEQIREIAKSVCLGDYDLYKPVSFIKKSFNKHTPTFAPLAHQLMDGLVVSMAINYEVSEFAQNLGYEGDLLNTISYISEFSSFNYCVAKEFFYSKREEGLTVRQILGDAAYLVGFGAFLNVSVYKPLRESSTEFFQNIVGMGYSSANISSQLSAGLQFALGLEVGLAGVERFQERVDQIDGKYGVSYYANAWGREFRKDTIILAKNTLGKTFVHSKKDLVNQIRADFKEIFSDFKKSISYDK